jgi:hypothetical protein
MDAKDRFEAENSRHFGPDGGEMGPRLRQHQKHDVDWEECEKTGDSHLTELLEQSFHASILLQVRAV